MAADPYTWTQPGTLRVEAFTVGSTGVAFSGLPVSICPFHDPTTLVPLWADAAMTVPLPNPLTTDNRGRLPLTIFAMPGIYDIWADDQLTARVTVRPNLLELADLLGQLTTLLPLADHVEDLVTYNPAAVSPATVSALVRNTASNIRQISAAATAAPGDFVEATVNAAYTVTLSGSAGAPGRAYVQYVAGTNTLTVTGTGVSTTLTTVGQEQDFEWDGTSWSMV